MNTDTINSRIKTDETINLRDYLRVVSKRRWNIAAFFTVTFFIVAMHTFTATPIFRATSRIVIEKENPNLVSVQEVMAVDATGLDYYQTQYKIIESRNVAREVIRQLDLENSREFFPESADHLLADLQMWAAQRISKLKKWIASRLNSGDNIHEGKDLLSRDTQLVSDFLARVSVNPIPKSRLVDVSVDAKDPLMSAKMTNALVKAYIAQNLETKLNATKDAVKWLSDRIGDERQKVEAAEQKLLKYKQDMKIITDFSSDTEKITAEKLATMNQQVVDAQSQRMEAETRYLQAVSTERDPDMLDSIPEVLNNEIIKEIKKMEVSLYNRMSDLSKKYGKNHPQMIAVQSELANLKSRKETEARRVINSLKNEYKLAVKREETLQKAFEAQKAESLAMNRKAIQYGALRREAESARNMYELLVKRFKETSLTEEMKTGNIRILDSAETPLLPIKPRKMMNLILAIFMGGIGGIGLAFFLEYLDNTIKFPDEIKNTLNLPFLGYIPASTQEIKSTDDAKQSELVVWKTPKAPVSEAFRGIRTSLLLSSPDKESKIILVTSAGPSEGKTFNVANLSTAIADTGAKVLVMDCDFRRPRIHKIFSLKNQTGITGITSGLTPISDTIIQSGVENLDILTSGVLPPNPSELLGSNKMAKLLADLKPMYDKIIIDTPPLTAVTDAVILSSMVDEAILVIRANNTPRQLIQIGIDQLRKVNSSILGAVLNGVKIDNSSYYYYYQYNYSSYNDAPKEKGATEILRLVNFRNK